MDIIIVSTTYRLRENVSIFHFFCSGPLGEKDIDSRGQILDCLCEQTDME